MKAHLPRWAGLLPVATVLASCGGSPAGPTTPPPFSVAIVGLPEAVSVNGTTALKAQVYQAATVSECAAPTWSVDDTKVATVSPAGVLSTTGTSGYVTVTATCDGVAAQAQTRVQRAGDFRFFVIAYDDVVKEPRYHQFYDVGATIEPLDGPSAGQTFHSYEGFGLTMLPARVRIAADAFAPRVAVLSDETLTRYPDTMESFIVWVPMTFTPEANAQIFIGALNGTDAHHAFMLPAAGPVRVRSWWQGEADSSIDRAQLELRCGGVLLESVNQWVHSAGDGFTKEVNAPGPCEVVLTSRSFGSYDSAPYRIAVTHPGK